MWAVIAALLGGVLIGVIGTILINSVLDSLSELKLSVQATNNNLTTVITRIGKLEEKVKDLDNDSKQRHESLCNKVLDLDRTIKSGQPKEEETETLDNRKT